MLVGALLTALPLAVSAETTSGWTYGIGSGIQFLNAQGDVGFTSFRGPEMADLDLDAEDFQDLMESAFGFSAFAAKDRWRFVVGYGTLRLEDRSSIVPPQGVLPPLNARFRLDITFAEAGAVYQFAETGRHRWGVLAGVRNTEHDYDVVIATDEDQRVRRLDQDWTDVLVGLTHAYAFSPKVVWNNKVVAGFGDSDTYWNFNTSIGYQFARSWNVGVFFDYRVVDVELEDPGDTDWYLYDADEWAPGISITYVFGNR